MNFEKVVANLKAVVEASRDKRLLPYYAEYLVALRLKELGHDVEILKKRRGPDIFDKTVNAQIEVKSSSIDLDEWACAASFYQGASIKKQNFDYCVFVVFKDFEPWEYLVFSIEELGEIAEKPRPYPITAFRNNPCVLFRYGSLQKYENAFPNVEDRLNIELKHHQNPGEFRDRWDKIKSKKQ